MSIIILGGGEIGFSLARELSIENRDVTVIESDPQKITRLEEGGEDLNIMQGSATSPYTLQKAGLDKAELMVAVTGKDEVNIAACYIASRLAPQVKKIARIREINTHLYGDIFTGTQGIIDSIINPEELCAFKIADLLNYPGITDINWFFDKQAVLLGIRIAENSPVKGKNLIAIGKERSSSGLEFMIGLIIRGETAQIPIGKDVITTGDHIYVMTSKQGIEPVLQYFCGPRPTIKNVAIFGGSNIGYYVAWLIEQQHFSPKLIERDVQRADFLAEHLDNTLVLKGELMDRAVYEIEGIAQSDAFVAVTADEEENIIATLYAKSKGVRTGICIIRQPHIALLAKKVGVDISIKPRQLAIGKILEYIRKGEIKSVVVLHQNDFEVIEARVAAHSRLVRQPLKDLKFAQNSLVMAVARSDGSIYIPYGDSVIMPGERVILISRKSDFPLVEKLISRTTGFWG